MTAPKRIQLRRTKGWRKPEGAIVVSRPSKWGNPMTPVYETGVDPETGRGEWHILYRLPTGVVVLLGNHTFGSREEALVEIVRRYRLGWLIEADDQDVTPAELLAELRGHDLCCWCPLDPTQPCHADVLLELANPDLPWAEARRFPDPAVVT